MAYQQPQPAYSTAGGSAMRVVVPSQATPYPTAAAPAARPVVYAQPGAPQVIYQQPVQMQPMVVQQGAPPGAVYAAPAAGMSGTTPAVRSVLMPAGGAAPVYTSSTPLPAGARVIRTSQVGPRVVTTQPGVAGPTYTQKAYEVKHEKDEQLQNLSEIRKTCGLKMIPVGPALKAFKKAADGGQLSRETFLTAYANVLQDHSIEVPSDEVKNAVFDLFDRDDNNVVDMMELICGISLLCAGNEEEKIHAVFEVFDENGDGYISMDEMYKFLTSVFKVVLTPAVMRAMSSMGVTVESAEDLASVTSLECFKTADLNQDGKLSVEEFKQWFYAPRNDPSFLFSPVRKLLQ
eukprot:TRINITY_DN6779_c0_g1_i1.p1 TRINITY_DN6779_c0_g1~~TRINITY_DN6779_c0_g1_i1.p1  ORF type:complete len:371 (+),score=91.20 TRINITY_DN6779_c0_g1_i1:73-1113(+)